MIRLVTKLNGNTVMDKWATASVTLDDILEIAECEILDGYADYALVEVDGEVYAEYEA